MVVQQGAFSLEIVDAYHRQKCPEHQHPDPTPSSGGTITIARVDPRLDHFVRLQVVGDLDPDQVFLFYINVNDTYIRHRQILSGNKGYLDVGLMSYTDSIVTGTNEPIQFQEAELMRKSKTPSRFIDEVPFHTNMIRVGKVTVKIYQGVRERMTSAFGNNCYGDEAYQPGKYIGMIQMECCATPEEGHGFLSMEDSELLKKALMKRSTSEFAVPSAKKMRTENGSFAVPNNVGAGGGMECS